MYAKHNLFSLLCDHYAIAKWKGDMEVSKVIPRPRQVLKFQNYIVNASNK